MKDEGEGKDNNQDARDIYLLSRVEDGDIESFHELFKYYYPRVYRFILRINHRTELAEEGANDTLFEVWRKTGGFQKNSKVSTWIYGIAYYKALKSLRADSGFQEGIEAVEEMVDPANGPDKICEVHEMQTHIREALKTLSIAQRATLELAFFFEYTYSEIASIMDCNENTVKTRIFRAKKHLSQILGEK